MKKLLVLLLCISFILCGCSENIAEDNIEIPFQKIAACNNRSKLLEKYKSISERTASRYAGDTEFSYWVIYYEKNGDSVNAILDYSADYKCYYYNNQVFADYGDGFYRTVLPFREKYDDIVSGLLARTDTLSYVFIINSQAEKEEEGYKTSYEFIVNNDILPEFEALGVKSGDRICIEYDLDEEYIIQRCRYYLVKGEQRRQIARIDITYNRKRDFPTEISMTDSVEKVDVKIVENFGTGAEYSETFAVPKGAYIAENETLLKYYLFKDPLYQEYYDTVSEPVEKNTDIFIIDSYYADVLQARKEYMEEKEETLASQENGEITEGEATQENGEATEEKTQTT